MKTPLTKNIKELIVAGGCFWCIEAHMRQAPGVVEAISGYSGGNIEKPTYENYAAHGYREVVRVIYDSRKTTYENLLKYFLESFDPTDQEGSFQDRGLGYTSAIYYSSAKEKVIAEQILEKLANSKIFKKPLAVEILEEKEFYKAEIYHQNYSEKNPTHYQSYHELSGRKDFVARHRDKIAKILKTEN